MGINRVNKSENYFVAPNGVFNDTNLSWEARGIMGYLLSKPNGWECRNYDLVNQSLAGKHVIQRVMKELETAGYIYRRRVSKGRKKGGAGTIEWVTEIYESPELNTFLRQPNNPTVRNSAGRKQGHIVSTDNNKDLLHKKPPLTPQNRNVTLGANAPGGFSKSKKQNTLGSTDQTLVANGTSATAEKRTNQNVSLVDETLSEFLQITGWPMPTAKNRVLLFKKGIRDHLGEKAFEGRLPEIYQAVWTEKREAVESGKLTLTSPGSFTNFMYRITNSEAPLAGEPSLNSLMNDGLVEMREDTPGSVTLVWVETGEVFDHGE